MSNKHPGQNTDQHTFSVNEKTVAVFPAKNPGVPLLVLNFFTDQNTAINDALRAQVTTDFSLIVIGGLDWSHDMAPWYAPPLFKDDVPCTGGAPDYLHELLETILPKAEQLIPQPVGWRGITGYSLAGLFAAWALYQTDTFTRMASMSGSFWFPDFLDYAKSHELKRVPECAYFSLGSTEDKTRNPLVRTVRTNTEALEEHFASLGVDTVFHINPGNHYQDGLGRTVAGMAWILKH